ncbi:MAG TPA: hypothetical protein VEA58_05695, partial [Anaerovoracaceae bacterium]|nr:hypothetical protein [Anaerovoracaceae bacterium]
MRKRRTAGQSWEEIIEKQLEPIIRPHDPVIRNFVLKAIVHYQSFEVKAKSVKTPSVSQNVEKEAVKKTVSELLKSLY